MNRATCISICCTRCLATYFSVLRAARRLAQASFERITKYGSPRTRPLYPMPIYKHSHPIACTIEDAFEYVADWSNLKNFMPMFVDIKPVSLVSYGPGTALETVMVLGKIEIVTTLDLVEFLKNKRILYKATRGIKSKISWDFAALGDKTLISFSLECEIPPALVNRDVEREAIEEALQGHAIQSMELLKWLLESQGSGRKE